MVRIVLQTNFIRPFYGRVLIQRNFSEKAPLIKTLPKGELPNGTLTQKGLPKEALPKRALATDLPHTPPSHQSLTSPPTLVPIKWRGRQNARTSEKGKHREGA